MEEKTAAQIQEDILNAEKEGKDINTLYADDDKGSSDNGDQSDNDKDDSDKKEEKGEDSLSMEDFFEEEDEGKEEDKDDKNKEEKEKGEDGDEEEDILSEEDRKAIDKRIDAQLKPVKETVDAREKEIAKDKRELGFKSYISERPEFKPYADIIAKYIHHDKFIGMGLKDSEYFDRVTAAVLGTKTIIEIGGKIKAEAIIKAKKGDVGAGSKSSTEGSGEIDWSTASKEEFEKQYEKVMGMS